MKDQSRSLLTGPAAFWVAAGMASSTVAQAPVDFSSADSWCTDREEKCVSASSLYRLISMRVGKAPMQIDVSIEMAAEQLARLLPSDKAPDAARIIELNALDGASPETIIPPEMRLRVAE